MRHQFSFLILFGLVVTLIAPPSYGQKLKFKEKLKVSIDGNDYKVLFVNPAVSTIKAQTAITYDAATNLPITYQLTEKLNWVGAGQLKPGSPGVPIFIQQNIISADVKAEDGKLFIYFHPFSKIYSNPIKEANKVIANAFLKSHTFSIDLPDRLNIGLRHSSLQAGVMTLPVRVFLGGPDSVTSVATSVNVGLYGGWRWGKTRFVKIPDDKDVTIYERSQSVNLIAGLGKLDLDENNTKDDGKTFKGGIGVLSTGISYGFHYKTFSLFGAIGIDIPLSKRGKLWSMKGRPWIGFGAGFEIL